MLNYREQLIVIPWACVVVGSREWRLSTGMYKHNDLVKTAGVKVSYIAAVAIATQCYPAYLTLSWSKKPFQITPRNTSTSINGASVWADSLLFLGLNSTCTTWYKPIRIERCNRIFEFLNRCHYWKVRDGLVIMRVREECERGVSSRSTNKIRSYSKPCGKNPPCAGWCPNHTLRGC